MTAYPEQLEHASIYTRGPEDSEESDGEGGLGNLSRLIVRPPGQSGKAKRGQLCFDAAYECGNLGRADHITDLEYDLFVRPDTCRPRSRQRIPRRLIFYHKSSAHRGRKILSIAFAFDREEDVYHFTAATPYSYSRCQKHLAAWEKKAQGFAARESIAQTTQKRRIELVTIGNFDLKENEHKDDHYTTKGKVVEPKKRVVFIIARAHGGEPASSFICQGLLDYLVSSSEKAVAIRNGIVIQVVPMLNPDGVFLGNQRSDLLGSDLNRCWNRATSFAHPALVAIKEQLNKLTTEKRVQLDFIIDIHGDISHEGVFVRGNSYDDVYRFERHAVLPKFLSSRVEAWRAEACFYNADSQAAGTARRTLPTGSVDGYSLLASLGGRRLTPRGPSPSSSPERRVVRPRILSPPLPVTSPPALRALLPRVSRHAVLRARPKTVPDMETILPVITGTTVRTPRLAVVDMSAYIRTPKGYDRPRGHIKHRLARPPRPSHARFTSDEYDTQESDS
ncbi:unnamed protein product [Diatraea saccharalis]|uniref:Peptidase M14 domain-containing protein n=1 Tax=Diatraea saccharalis TaxID=40085 RepID=A0A9N9QVH4_9NEOP|nr:unnamed protein product [Diatraea saccharalis]